MRVYITNEAEDEERACGCKMSAKGSDSWYRRRNLRGIEKGGITAYLSVRRWGEESKENGVG